MSMEEALRRIAECKKQRTKKLLLSALDLEVIPKGIMDLEWLEYLDISYNNIKKIENLENLKFLTNLSISYNKIFKIEGLNNLQILNILDLSSNQIAKIEGLEKCIHLTVVDLRINKIKKIERLNHLKFLRDLYLGDNNIEKIEGLNKLESLMSLDLSQNEISIIGDLSKLKLLYELDLHSNKISKIIEFEKIRDISSLNFLRFSNNPVLQMCGLVLDDYEKSNHLMIILNFFNQPRKDIYLPCRIILLGNHAAGKTSLLYYIKNKSLPYKSQSTHGLQVEQIFLSDNEKDNVLPDAIFFDFGGQDYYHGIYRLFLRQQSSQVIVVNPTCNVNQLRLENTNTVLKPQYTQDFSLDYWAAQLSYFGYTNDEQTINRDTFLVQSYAKSHLQQWNYSHSHCLESRLLRFDYLELKDNHQSLNLQHFREALLHHINSNKKTVFQTEKRTQLIQYILTIWKDEKISSEPIKVDELNNKLNGESYPTDWFKIDLGQLSAAGLIWYDEKIANGDFVWLNPKALVEDLHQRVFSPECLRHASHQGRLTVKELEKLKLHQATIELLQFYRVIFKHQPNKFDYEKIEYIIPNYLPLSSQDNTLYSLSTFGLEQATFRLRFLKFMPMGLINQLVCFFGCQPDHKLFWRDLIVFTLSEDLQGRYRVMIKLDFNQLEIQVCIQPQNNKNQEEYQEVKKYLFYCLMRFYWDLYAKDKEPTSYKKFYDYILIKNYKTSNINRLLSYYGDIWAEFYVFDIKRISEKQRYFIPNDLYVSIGAEHWVHYHQLAQYPNNEPHIQSYRLEESTPKLAKIIPVKPFEIFLNRELRAVKKIFISYSRKDVEYKDELSLFLKTALGSHGHEVWDCGLLEEGKWDEQIQTKLAEADLVIFMLSINFFASNYIVNQELLNTLANINQANAKQKIMCIVVKTFPWDSFARLAKQSHVDDDRIGQLADIYHQKPQKEDITQYQFLPYRRLPQSSINDQKHELIMPLARISADERDEVYSDIVARVMKALGI